VAAATTAQTPGTVELQNVGKAFVGRTTQRQEWAIRHVTFSVEAGEFFVLLGPSGCGKSTLLRVIAGVIAPMEGRIFIAHDGQAAPWPGLGMVFQSIDSPLFDWLTARENVEFGLWLRSLGRAQRAERARHFLTLVGLGGHAHKFPHEMSGGMKQRLQIARALATEPSILLMDEPFASVDAQTRRILQNEVQRLWLETRKTILYVTHDIREALILGQRIAVMTAGPTATIARIYEQKMPYPRDDLDPDFSARFRVLEAHIAGEVSKGWGEPSP